MPIASPRRFGHNFLTFCSYAGTDMHDLMPSRARRASCRSVRGACLANAVGVTARHSCSVQFNALR